MEYTLHVKLNEQPVKLFFNNELLLPERSLSINTQPYYSVRRADDLDAYNTINFIPTGYEGTYIGTICTGDDLIIEFYNENKEIVESYYAVAQFIKTIPNVSFLKATEIFDDLHE